MKVEYADDRYRRMAEEPHETGGFDVGLVKVYRKRVQYVLNAVDERDFYAMKSLHYEKLKGDRECQHSMRLNDQWRLILKLATDEEGRRVVIFSITDYH